MFDPQLAATYASVETQVLVDLHRTYELLYSRAMHERRAPAMHNYNERMQLIRAVLGERLNATFVIRDTGREPAITCLACGRTSYNANDVEQRYCGYCHVFHEEQIGGGHTR